MRTKNKKEDKQQKRMKKTTTNTPQLVEKIANLSVHLYREINDLKKIEGRGRHIVTCSGIHSAVLKRIECHRTVVVSNYQVREFSFRARNPSVTTPSWWWG